MQNLIKLQFTKEVLHLYGGREFCEKLIVNCFVLYFSDLPPNQGGRYSGFGYTMDPPPRSTSQELFDNAVSSLASVSITLF